MRSDRDAPARGLALLDVAAALAVSTARPIDQAIALTHAGLLAQIAGDEAAAIARLEAAVAAAPSVGPSELVIARVVLSSLRPGAEGFAELSVGLEAAAATGDYAAYVVLIVTASRKAHAAGRVTDAIAIVDNGIANLAPLGAAATRPLTDERARVRAAIGADRFDDAATLR